MANPALIDKLRKVLALTTSPVEAEAALAAEMLQSLLTKHNLDMADLEQQEAKAAPAVHEQQADLGKAAFKWKLDLASHLANHYFCVPIVRSWSKHAPVSFVGRPDNVDALKMLYFWLIDQIRRIASEERRAHIAKTGEHVDPLRWQLHFGLGAVNRLRDRLEEMCLKAAGDVQVTALVVHHLAEASDYTEAHYGYRADGRKTKRDQEWDAEWEAMKKAKEELLKSDPDEYYRQYPHERPEAKAKAEKESAKRHAAWERKWARQQAREEAKYWSPGEIRRRAQQRVARDSGREAADRINLQPFLAGDDPGRAKLEE